MNTISCICSVEATHGEGAFWDYEAQALYWVDIITPTLYKLDYKTGDQSKWSFDEAIGFVIRRTGGGLVVGMQSGLALFNETDGSLEYCHNPEPKLANNRFNDAKCDQMGRLWAGTMDYDAATATGALYCITHLNQQWQCDKKDADYWISNGPAFSVDQSVMYHNETANGSIYAFDFDVSSGSITNKRLFYKFDEQDGAPDGMTTDIDGNLWVCAAKGGQILCVSPDGKCLKKIKMPVTFITSCVFGGPKLDQLFVTTSRLLDPEVLAGQTQAGSVFCVDVHTTGMPGNFFAG